MRRLYLMRHGETLYLGRACPDGSDLTAEGRRQAEAVAEALAGLPLDLVLSSPLRRARGTAAIVARPHALPVESVAALREITPRPAAGTDMRAVFGQMVAFFAAPDGGVDTPFVGGETFREVGTRTAGFLGGLLARPGWATALAVAHGGTNTALLARALGLTETVPRLEQDLACLNVIDFDDAGRALVRLVNSSVHDVVKAASREPTVRRLERLLVERGAQLAGLRWEPGGQDQEV